MKITQRIGKLCLLLIVSIFSTTAFSQLSGGGDLNPDLKAPKKAQEKWMDLRVGLSVHWGPSSLGGEEISWARDRKIPKEVYDNYYKSFAPTKFNAEEWASLMKRWGIKYMAPTAKHHDGFCLWYSDYTPYDMESAKYKVDIMKELSKACKRHHIMLGAYYSNLDWYHPDWAPYNFGGPGPLIKKQNDSPNLERYFTFFENQCLELINKYNVDFIQFDGEWDKTYTHEVGSRLYRRFHEEKPEILLNSRIDIGRRSVGKGNHLYMDGLKYCGDFQDRERLVKHGNNVTAWLDHPWQAWVTIDKNQWSYNKTPKLMSPNELIRDMVGVVGNNGNYMINLGPRPDGAFEQAQIALMDSLGKWLHQYGKAIYETRGGPFYPYKGGVSTRKGRDAWLLVTDPTIQQLHLPALGQEPISAKVFGTKQKISWKKENNQWIFDLSTIENMQPVRVVALRFKKRVGLSPIKKVLSSYEIEGAKQLTNGLTVKYSSVSDAIKLPINIDALIGDQKVRDFSFQSKKEKTPYIELDLQKERKVYGIKIHRRVLKNNPDMKTMNLSISGDAKSWTTIWKTTKLEEVWDIPFNITDMGATIQGRSVRYIRIGLDSNKPVTLSFSKLSIYTKE
ncbi:alpha-L-fucosidase [Halosquirtibacter xylanolyticus]|uniref:alpha-L-fucosidase n=1 Tax=Halosquirtibacter xylanolyticus TaxID=3374599 RepID=UPI003749CA89|nr:alpha-L-fucosidase [Prolixibacteraceae bacterium]